MERSSLWEGVQPLIAKTLIPTCTIFDLTFREREYLVSSGYRTSSDVLGLHLYDSVLQFFRIRDR